MRTDIRVLIVDESESLRNSLEGALFTKRRGVADSTSDSTEALGWVRDREYDLCIVEALPENLEFLQVLSERRSEGLSPTGIVLTGKEGPDVLLERFNGISVDACLNKVLDSPSGVVLRIEGVLLCISSRILVVEESLLARRKLVTKAKMGGFPDVTECDNGLDALLRLPMIQPDLILLGSDCREITALNFIREVRKDNASVRIVALIDPKGLVKPGELLRNGANDYMDIDALRHTLREIAVRQLEIRNESLERDRLRAEIEERDRQTQNELELAAVIQGQILPSTTPSFSGYRFSVVHYPSRQIGGDLFDFRRLDDERLLLVFSDISGHGIPGALLSIAFKIYWELVLQESDQLLEILISLGRRLHQIYPPEAFASTFALVLHASGEVEYTKASQEPAFWVKGDGTLEELDTDGFVLALFSPEFAEGLWESKRLTMAPGEKIVLYTDGVTEAQNPHGEEYGQERLKSLLVANGGLCSDDLCKKISESARRFRGRETFEDDFTAMVIERVDE